MNRLKFFLLLILGLFLASSALHSDTMALAVDRADNQITWSYVHNQTIDPGFDWWSEDGYHIRDRVDIGRTYGDIDGVVKVVYNGDFYQEYVKEPPSTTPFSGRAYGIIEIRDTAVSLPSPDTAATWVGAWVYEIKDDVVVDGRMWAVHTEAPEMMIIDKVLQTARNVIVHAGFIDQVYCPDTICPDPNER